jgi:hypothetical protein
MPTPTNTFNDGDVMFAGVASTLASIRTYMAGGWILADFDANGIRSEQCYRPDFYAVPEVWLDGDFAQIHGATAGQQPSPIPRPYDIAADGRGFGLVRDRFPIYPNLAVLNNVWAPVERLSRRLYVEVPSNLRITAQWFTHHAQDGVTAPIRFGSFNLRWRRVEDGPTAVPAILPATDRMILAPEFRHQFTLHANLAVVAGQEGTYDIGVCYNRDTLTSAEAYQISTMQRHLGIEVLKGV